MLKFKLKEALKAVNGKYYGNLKYLESDILGVSIDSREIKKGFLFIPIKGERFNGHDFIASAYENGALCCFSEKVLNTDKPYILVESALNAFQDLAEFYRSLFSIKVVGITGSVGKTTTKELVACVLSKKYNVLKSKGNFNNQIGVPLTIFRLEKEHEVAVIEMGTNHFGEIRNLAKMARPDICIFTNIGESHLEYLGTKEGVLKAKSEMLDYMREDGTIIINGDDNLLPTLKGKGLDIISFGKKQSNFIYARGLRNIGLLGLSAIIGSKGKVLTDIFIPSPGEHMLYNALAAFSAGVALNLSIEQIKAGIKDFIPTGNRMNIINLGKIIILNDCYNANPASMKAALDVLATAKGRKVCILGDMLELGDNSKAYHFEIGQYACEKNMDIIIAVGELSKNIYDGAVFNCKGKTFYFESQNELLKNINKYIAVGDVILIKASRGMKLENTFNKLRELYN
ncbi:MAG: UDP-N-acetylmuramoyl-tripeptide--D-alanyl-D-alanine ligase [Eubacteriales bacterium]